MIRFEIDHDRAALVEVYTRIKEGKILPALFYDGSVQSEADFLAQFFESSDLLPIRIFSDEKLAVWSWLSNIEKRSAQAHFCAFPEVWGREALKVCRKGLEFYAGMKRPDGGWYFDCIWGTTPVSNPLACKFVQKIGMIPVGIIPKAAWNHFGGCSVDAMLTYSNMEALRNGKVS